MRILVYGAGAVGCFYGALLARRGTHDVSFVARGRQLAALGQTGIRIDSALIPPVTVPAVRVVARAADAGTADLVLLCVKAHQTPGVLADLDAAVGPDTTVVPMQNGVESDALLAGRYGWPRVVTAVVYVGASLSGPGVVRHAAAGSITLGVRPGGDRSRLDAVSRVCAEAGIETTIADDIERERWLKLLWNAGFNTVTALTLRLPEELMALPPARALVRTVMEEVVAVATRRGLALHASDIEGHLAFSSMPRGIRTSMMEDRARGRPMETDALIGVVVRAGRALGVPTPASEAVHALLTAIDAGPRPPGETGT